MSDNIKGDIFINQPPKQTLVAWGPFWDCVDILFQFQNSDGVDGDVELPEWRIFWVAGIALLRTIGHVLAKVDANRSTRHSQVIGELWRRLKSDRSGSQISWDFIEKERNSLLKTYTFGARLSRDEEGYFVAFTDNEDAFQMFREAVYWWRRHLVEIENVIVE